MQTFSAKVHLFQSATATSCAYEHGRVDSKDAIVFIGGLTSGPHTTPYVQSLAQALEQHADLSYSVWEFRMRSSYDGFGFSSLGNDVADTAAFVKYLRAIGKQRVILLGSSTGCQCIMTYSAAKDAPTIDAYIMQAPTSDRETATILMPPDFLAKTLEYASAKISQARGADIMPAELVPPIFTSPISAYRWHSLLSEGGDDDFFSSDIPDGQLRNTFGKVKQPTLIVPSEKDELVPGCVDKTKLLARWKIAAEPGVVSELSAINPGADHALSEKASVTWFIERVIEFLESLSRASSVRPASNLHV